MDQKFLIGAATAAHQVEGYNIHSDYWMMENLEHSTFAEKSGAAVDHYSRFREDIRLLAEAGGNAYRFSIEWARIEPEEDMFDETQLQHYREVLDCCEEYGVTPIVTLHHFSSPAWLIGKGGWGSPYVTEAFARYAGYLVSHIDRSLPYICTINEANMGLQMQKIMADMMSAMQQEGEIQVGVNLDMETVMLAKEAQEKAFGCEGKEVHTFLSGRTKEQEKIVMEAHCKAYETIKSVAPESRVGLTLSLFDYQPLAGGERLAEELWEEEFGFYLPYISKDDFLGVQNYSRKIITASGVQPHQKETPVTQMGYEDYPESIGHVIRKVAESFHGELIVTENGIATDDDTRRCEFIREAFGGIMECVRDGIPVTGYCHWSLLDNFEWQAGFGKTFGLIAVERSTQERKPKKSLRVLGELKSTMSGYYCNPINLTYRYQYNQKEKHFVRNREAADPSLITYKGKYYLFPSMSRAFFSSTDFINWQMHDLKGVPVYDYAPDVRVIGKYMYFSASKAGEICHFYRTEDPESDEFEMIEGTFDFWDPNLFVDDDGRVYFYWGCSNVTPIWGVELDQETMKPLGERKELISNHKTTFGYERVGENHIFDIKSNNVWLMVRKHFAEQMGCQPEEIIDLEPLIAQMPEEQQQVMRTIISDNPYIEGPWMTKYNGQYYLQYACTGTEYNVYGDGVYISEEPLGPFVPAKNNPYSYNPGGFCPGAGHGSTVADFSGNYWHTATMRISVNHAMERRVGLWRAGFDEDGELFCNQRYGDWPVKVEQRKADPWADPEWMLLSYNKKVSVSSGEASARNAVDENIQTWWRAESNHEGEWICLDLGNAAQVNAIQVNFADEPGSFTLPEGKVAIENGQSPNRYIEETIYQTQWLLEGSLDGQGWFIIEDKRNVDTDFSHDLVVREEGFPVRHIRLTVYKVPYNCKPCISGLRVFGHMEKPAPKPANAVCAKRINGTDMTVTWKGDAEGAVVLWGHKKDKLYHSYHVHGVNTLDVGALVADTKEYYVRVDLYNEGGITKGEIVKVTQ